MTGRFKKKFRKGVTVGELYMDLAKVETKEDADEYLESLIQHGMSNGQTREEAREIQLANIGYFAGYFRPETYKRILELFNTSHPFFGKTMPSNEEAFQMGKEYGASYGEKKK